MRAWIGGLLMLALDVALAWVILTFAPDDLRPWMLPIALALVTAAGVLALIQRRRQTGHVPRFEAEDRRALLPLIVLECRARLVRLDGGRERYLSRWAEWRCKRKGLREAEEAWARSDVEVGECEPVYHQGAQWTPDVSKVATGVMLTLKCSNTSLLRNLACRVDTQESMKHQSIRTGPLASMEVRFKYPRDFPWAPALPSFGEWLEASWFQPQDEDEDVQDVGLGREIVTCRFRVVQTSAGDLLKSKRAAPAEPPSN